MASLGLAIAAAALHSVVLLPTQPSERAKGKVKEGELQWPMTDKDKWEDRGGPNPANGCKSIATNWELCLSYATPTTSNGMELRSFLPPPTTSTSSSCSSVHADVIPCRAAGPSAGKLEERGAHRCCGVDVCVFVRPRPVAQEQRISLTGGMEEGWRRR